MYFNNVIVLQSNKEGCSWLIKNQTHWNCSYIDKKWCVGSDIRWNILSQLSWHVVPSSNILTRYLKTSPVGNGCGKHAAMNSIYCPSHDAVHENTGFAFSTVFWPCFAASSHCYHFGSRFLVTIWSHILRLLQTGAEIWAQVCSRPECWVHTVCCIWCWPKHKFTGCPNTWNKMDDIANISLGRLTTRGILRRTVKMDELQIVGHIQIRSFITFSVGLNLQGHEILKSKIALTLHHQTLNGKCPSHIIPGLSKCKQYTGIHIQASVLSSICHDRHWPWGDTDLWDTAKHYSTMLIFMYDHPLWWKSIIIIKNELEPSNLHCFVPRRDGFHTLRLCFRWWITSWQLRVSGHYLHLLKLKTQWLTS